MNLVKSSRRFYRSLSKASKNEEKVRVFERWDLESPVFSWIPEKERENYAKIIQYHYHNFYDSHGNSKNQDNRNIAINFKGFERVPDLTHPYPMSFPIEQVVKSAWTFPKIFTTLLNKYMKTEIHIRHMKTLLETTEEDLKEATKQAFHVIMETLVSKDLSNFQKCFAFDLDQHTPFALNDAPDNAFYKFFKKHETVDKFNMLKITGTSGTQEVEVIKKVVKKVKYRDLVNAISELNLELNFIKDDVVFIPDDEKGHIFYSIRRELITENSKNYRLLVTIPVVALYKKKELYESIISKPLLSEGDEIPTKVSSKNLLKLIEYGYTRPIFTGALITFSWLIDVITKTKASDAELFGFYLQLPQRRPYLRYV